MTKVSKIKLSGETYEIQDKSAYVKPVAGVPASDLADGVIPDISGKAESSDLTTHTSDTTIHVTSGNKETWNAKYDKPSTGIPSTDLAEAVQTSLGLADTALQSFTETDPTVPDWAKASTKPTYTASEVGLGNVTNDAQVTRAEMGVANGVATLGSDGKVPSSQLPAYVDDVLEYANTEAFPATGEAGKIYVALDTNKTYRWGGSAYAEISASIAIGTTTGTAADGKVVNDHITDSVAHVTANDKSAWNGAVTALGGLKLQKITQQAYDDLQEKDENTLYVIRN